MLIFAPNHSAALARAIAAATGTSLSASEERRRPVRDSVHSLPRVFPNGREALIACRGF